ncbi:sugar phosphate isomerase/epimerase family protein [Roseivirga misakiensis]|uniref:Xylose isomerase n=1 Tax=Roseivirga misakiensis TaxID=1563681 RepID=A0A1E5SZC1_9BACT|nr:sugar phosphate isomerase/epimerase family protein [Roseivirga misakiensis]OEK04478.1 xylose isomerase [Roseivirga misakiensis]
MIDFGRRAFLTKATLLSAAALYPSSLSAFFGSDSRKFKICLNPGAIGVKLSQKELLEMAVKYGFEAIVPFPDQLARYDIGQKSQLIDQMAGSEISWGTANLPVQFRASEQQFRNDLKQLDKSAKTLAEVGASRMSTWIMPTHDELTYRKNFDRHALRLKEVAKVLDDSGIKLGLEYVGPKTLMARDKYSFIRSMAELSELIDGINQGNVGYQLDAFHWYCAGETKADILNLNPDQIITVDLNDAKAGRSADEQLDWERELPATSGVVSTKEFLSALVEIGYDGPVRAEPFNEELNKLQTDQALKKTIGAIRNAISQID